MVGKNGQLRIRRTEEDYKEAFRDILRTMDGITKELLEEKKKLMRDIADELDLPVEIRQRLQIEAKAEVDHERIQNEENRV